VVRLADTEGLETLAEVWSGAPADTLAGSLWRLFLLRSWVYAGPDELRLMVDEVLRGITRGDFAVTLFRAAAFARIVAAGRAALGSASHGEITRMLTLSEQLEAAGHVEIRDKLA
jgi:hypothetical protein